MRSLAAGQDSPGPARSYLGSIYALEICYIASAQTMAESDVGVHDLLVVHLSGISVGQQIEISKTCHMSKLMERYRLQIHGS